MSKYLVVANTYLNIDSDEDLADYLSDRKAEWFRDEPEQVGNLEKNGVCTFNDNVGTTTIRIMKVTEDETKTETK